MRSCGVLCFGLVLALLCGCRDPQLIRSIRQGESAVSQKMVVDGVNVNAKDRQGQTALYAAIEARDKETYLLLLGKGANPNLCDHVGMSPIHLAAEQDDIFWLREALQHGGNPNELNTGNTFYPNETPIFYAISKVQSENVLELIAAGADVNHVDGNGWTPLYAAMYSGMFCVMMKLLEAGADPTPAEPAFSIFSNGWFNENYVKVLETDEDKRDYFALKTMLIDKGYLKPDR